MLREGTTLTAGYAALSIFCSSGTAVKYYGPVFALHHTWQGERSLINEMGCFTRGLTRSTVPIKDALNLRGTTGIIYRPGLPVGIIHRLYIHSIFPPHTYIPHTHTSLCYIDMNPELTPAIWCSSWNESRVIISYPQTTSPPGLYNPQCCLGVDISAFMVEVFFF